MGFSIATFNVRDLFDDAPPHVIGELDSVPKSSDEQGRAARLYRRKLETLASVVRRVDADVLALQEVKNAKVLDDLRALLPPREGVPAGGYGPGRAGVADGRGIACGLLTRLPLLGAIDHVATNLAFPVFVEGDPVPFPARLATQRGVLEARLALPDGSSLIVLVVHFKSGRPTALVQRDGSAAPLLDHYALAEADVRSVVARLAEALFVRRLVDAHFDADPRVQLAVVGDFNDHERSPTVRAVAGSMTAARLDTGEGSRGFRGRALYACARAVPPVARYSVLYQGDYEQLDHVLASEALWERCLGARFLNETLGEDSAALDADPLSPQSDHAPLRVDFR